MFRMVQQAGSGGLMQRAPALQPPPSKPSFQAGTHILEIDPDTGRQLNSFRIVRLLGKGGFAKCYEVSDGKGSYAVKVINRTLLSNPKTLQKLHSEITIHRRMKHENIVRFLHTFKDEHYVYILLEKCENGTLMDLLKARPLTVPETQYVMLQCLSAMEYMHEEGVIHRDLKPGNIMLDGNLTVKIGDFGLAAELFYDGERKRTICGTPNYIAPEIIDRRGHGHSFEADIWSLGVVLFTLLVGQPPFQTDSIDTTYRRIRACRYDCPRHLPEPARNLIGKILQSSPTSRPTLRGIRIHPFFTSPRPPGSPPGSLALPGRDPPSQPPPASRPNASEGGGGNPSTKLRTARPRGMLVSLDPNRLPPPPEAGEIATKRAASNRARPRSLARSPPFQRPFAPEVLFKRSPRAFSCAAGRAPRPSPPPLPPPPEAREGGGGDRRKSDAQEELQQLTTLHDQLHRTLCLHDDGEPTVENEEERQRREGGFPSPRVWVVACADFSAKYGICYRLSTGQTGVYFNDSTKMIWDPVLGRVEYYARVRVEIPQGDGENALYAKDQLEAFHIANAPGALEKKITLIKYFTSYLSRTHSSGNDKVKVVRCSLYSNSDPPQPSDPQEVGDFAYVKRWLRTDEAIVFRLSNKTVQVCFNDGAEIILSSEWRVVTYTNPSGNRRTLALATVAIESEEAASRLHYTKAILYKLIKEHCL